MSSANSKTRSTLKVEPIAGEYFLRFYVESHSDPTQPKLVDLSFRGGWGRCSCPHWECDIWKIIRDQAFEAEPGRIPEPMTYDTTCKHVRAAFAYWARAYLPLVIKHLGQFDPNESL